MFINKRMQEARIKCLEAALLFLLIYSDIHTTKYSGCNNIFVETFKNAGDGFKKKDKKVSLAGKELQLRLNIWSHRLSTEGQKAHRFHQKDLHLCLGE